MHLMGVAMLLTGVAMHLMGAAMQSGGGPQPCHSSKIPMSNLPRQVNIYVFG